MKNAGNSFERNYKEIVSESHLSCKKRNGQKCINKLCKQP